MPRTPFTPGEQATLDQMMAGIDASLDRILSTIRKQIAESGEPQALANTALALTTYNTPEQNAGLLVVALHRLARDAPGENAGQED